MKTYRLLFWVVVGLIILLPSGSVKALTIGGINVTEVTSGDGLYSDSYETGRYVYRGSDVNNYIWFNEEMWRIIAIESNGTLKIMKNDSIGDMQFDPVENRTEGYCSLGSAYKNGCNAWAKMEYFSNGSSYYGEVTEDSYLNAYLNGEYYDSLNSTAQSLIVEYAYNIGGVSYSSAWDTSYTITKQLEDELKSQWMGKIALINLSDYIRSNSSKENYCDRTYGIYYNYETCQNTTWMYSGSDYWTITPVRSNTDNVWHVLSWGGISFYSSYARNSYGVHPVFHLTSDLTLSGSGTEEDPYTIVQTNISDIAGEITDDTSVQVVEVPATFMSTFKAVGLGILLVTISGMTIYIIIHKKKINNLPH